MRDALDLLRGLVLEDGRRWGEAAVDFQRDDAAAILDRCPDAPTLFYLTRPRGASKTSDVAGVVLALLLEVFGPGDAGHVFAVDADQAAELIRAAAGYVARTGELRGLVDVQTRRIVLPNGASFSVVPADAASAFGLRSRAIVFDEFAALGATPEPKRLWEAALSTVPKLDALLVLLTTAGDPGSWQARVLEQAKGSARWYVNETPGPVPWISSDALEEQQRLLLPSQYARLHLNRWVAPEDRLTSADDVQACVTHPAVLEPQRGVRYVLGVDIGIKFDATAIAVGHAQTEAGMTRVVIDQLRAFVPSRAKPVDLAVVEATVTELSRSYNGARAIFDPHQAALMTQNLRRRGLKITEYVFAQASISALALNLYRLLRDHQIGLPDDPELLDELGAVELREVSPSVYRMDHSRSGHDDRAIAVGLVALELVSRRAQAFTVAGPGGDLESSKWVV